MSPVKSLEELKRLKEEALAKRQVKTPEGNAKVVVGMGTCGIAAGARETMKAILGAIETGNLSGIVVSQTGCVGMCEWEPIVEVSVGNMPQVTYGKVSPDKAREIMQQHIVGGKVIEQYVIH